MSCFKKDGTIKKVYADLVPLIEKAEPYHSIITVKGSLYEYICCRFEVPKSRKTSVVSLLDELGVGYKIWAVSSDTIAVDIINNDEVLDIVRQAD